MGRYLAELYLPKSADIAAATKQAKAAAESGPARCLRSIFVPEDETWFLLYESPTIEAVQQAVQQAGLPCARVVGVVAAR